MSSSEIAFLALGLVLGGALGAAFLAAVRTRPVQRREVRVTIAPNSIAARRAVTLADPMSSRDRPSPPGSPDDAAWPDRPATTRPLPSGEGPGAPLATPPLRTRVLSGPAQVPVSAVAVPVGAARPMTTFSGNAPAARRNPEHEAISASLVRSAVAIAVIDEPPSGAPGGAASAGTPPSVLDIGQPVPERLVRLRYPAPDARPTLARTAVALPIARSGDGDAQAPATPRRASRATIPTDGSPDPCASTRSEADARCTEATGARDRARFASDALREAQRAHETLRHQVDTARDVSDARTIAALKASLHAAFREANAKAATPEHAESAARLWLAGIDRANTDARAALRLVETATVTLRDQVPALDRLSVEADAARITAESAEQACMAARGLLARCEEREMPPLPLPPIPHPFDEVWPTEQDLSPERRAPADILGGVSAIVRMLHGDRSARDRVVSALAGGDAPATAAWQLRISDLVDGIAGRAIEDGYLDLPDDDPFWALFSRLERRGIVAALSSLGFRFDGLGGFADGRAPAARDLSLAVGYAGLDPMRIRIWPRDAEFGALYARADVAADEWLASEAGDLDLDAIVSALGHRATDLADLWNAWGRVRPLLLASD